MSKQTKESFDVAELLRKHSKKMTEWLNSDDEEAVKTRKGLDRAQKRKEERMKSLRKAERVLNAVMLEEEENHEKN